ncbi:hypothetical protein [Novosphingobium sp. FSW06-99]|uniref:hypothetical protein n=1 Tax=Novosphingobium sp. FSW06-99 TaxID=1739113 RepID=UPI00076C3CBA|nr:hypothetical protein [Novosphingobium sp. FSW06-99]KUR80962.1 hypothetical protein AQZ49_00435 [Novosphingobium sp. FSW06-99]
MKRTLVLLALLISGANPAQAVPGGNLRTLLKGYWVCETQGDATEPPKRQLQDSFRVIPDSSYRTTTGMVGTYLLLGTDLTMTGGPFKGRTYKLVGQGILHVLDSAGKRTTERCVRQASASSLDDGPDDT